MGWQGIVAPFVQAGNTIVLNSQGFFVYNGPPASGNLVASSAPVAGTDPYGNPVLAGDAVYGAQSSSVNIATNNGFAGFPAITIRPPGMAHITDLPQVATDHVNPGAANEQAVMVLSSGKENSLDDGAMKLFSESADGTIGAAMIIEFLGFIYFTANRSGFFLGSQTNSAPLFFICANAAHVTDRSQLFATTLNTGAANEQLQYVLTSGKENHLDDAALQLFSESNDATLVATAIIEFGGTVIVRVNKTGITESAPLTNTAGSISSRTLVTTDSFHAIILDANWSTLGGQPVPSYQMCADGMVQITGAIQFNVNIANNNINGGNPLPAAYRPATQIFLAGAPGSAGIAINTNGVIVASQAPGQTTVFCNFCGRYPVNL